MDKDLQKAINGYDMAKENAEQLAKAFGAPFTEVGVILADYPRDEFGEIVETDRTVVVSDETDERSMKKARELRLVLKKTRTTVENKRKELKEESLRKGKAIDGVAKYIKDQIQPVEEYLEKQEKFAEIQAEKRKLELKRIRAERISDYTDNPFAYQLDTMADDEFEKLFTELKEAHKLRVAQAEAYEREQERLRQEREQEEVRLREENETLKAQAAVREAEIQKQQEVSEAVQRAQVAAVRSEAEKKIILDIKNKINALERTDTSGVSMISYDEVIAILD